MAERIKLWKCPSCGTPVVWIVRKSTTPDGIADMCDYEFLPEYGGFKEVSKGHGAFWCKKCYADLINKEAKHGG